VVVGKDKRSMEEELEKKKKKKKELEREERNEMEVYEMIVGLSESTA
jgi:hypothetical protein